MQASIDFYHRYLDRRGVSRPNSCRTCSPRTSSAAETAYPESHERAEGDVGRGAWCRSSSCSRSTRSRSSSRSWSPPRGRCCSSSGRRATSGAAGVHQPTRAARTLLERDRCGCPDTTLLAHNEHWLAGDLGNVAVVIDLPDDGRVPVVSPTVVCCLPAVGHERPRGRRRASGRSPPRTTASASRGCWCRASSLEARDREPTRSRARPMPGRAGGYGHVYGVRRRRRVHGGDDRAPAPRARRSRAAHEPLPRRRPGRDGAAALRRAAGPGSAACRSCSRSANRRRPRTSWRSCATTTPLRRRSACIPSPRRATRPPR